MGYHGYDQLALGDYCLQRQIGQKENSSLQIEFTMIKNVLLIGGGGFVGKHVIDSFNEIGDVKLSILDKYDDHNLNRFVKYIGEIENVEFVKSCISSTKPDLIYYLASSFAVKDLSEFANAVRASLININNLLACLEPGVRFVYTGSSAQYGTVPISDQPVQENYGFYPVSNYGILKTIEEIELRRMSAKYDINLVIARIFNITGPGEPTRMVGGAFTSQLIKSRFLKAGNLFPKRDFLDIRDVASALRLIGEKGISGSSYNVCSGESISINEFLTEIGNALNIEPQIEVDQARINENEILDLVGNNTKLTELGWKRKYNLKRTIADLTKSYLDEVNE